MLSNSCAEHLQGAGKALQKEVEEMLNKMKAVMVEGLLHYARNEREYTEIFALAVSPLVSLRNKDIQRIC